MKKIIGIALSTGLVLGPAVASGSEPSVLELRQLQTRIFKAPPEKVHGAIIEWCKDKGGSIQVTDWNRLPEHHCFNVQARSYGYTLTREQKGQTIIRVRVANQVTRTGALGVVTDSEPYESFFKSIADMLVLNEMGVEIKVFK